MTGTICGERELFMKPAGFHFAAHHAALMYAKEHVPENKYQEIRKSYRRMFQWTLVFVLCCLPIMIAFMFLACNAPFSTRAESSTAPDGAAGYVLARVDYDGNFYWTHDSKIYEYPLKDYGLHPEDYEFGDQVKVYFNKAQNILSVTAAENGPSLRNTEVGIGVIGAIFVPFLLICGIYVPIAYRTFGKCWIEFYQAFNSR